jgi:hypothetical protein
MRVAILKIAGPIVASAVLAGCAAINFSEIQAVAPSIEACLKKPTPGAATPAEAAAAAVADRTKTQALSGRLHFEDLTNSFTASTDPSVTTISTPAASVTFKNYVAAAQSRANAAVPPDVRSDPVFGAVRDLMIKATASASMQRQVATARALNVPIAATDIAEVNAFGATGSVSHGDLKAFTKLLTSYGLHPTMRTSANAIDAPVAGAAAQPKPNAFSKYFTAYYSGKFYDRLGVAIAKPTASLTITDAEIASALTMLLEYAADLYDPTPVMVNGSTYYPGNNSNEPTALSAGVASSQTIGADSGCNWNTKDAPVLGNLASAAADQAGAVGGLVTGTWGGWEIGFGFLGKFSLGDNQTLATIAKTFASRVAERTTLASIYWALEDTQHSNSLSPEALVTY